MVDFITRIWSGEKHWAMENPRWFLTLFAGVWIVPFLFWQNLNQSAKRFSLGSYLSSSVSFQIEYDGNKGLQRIECYRGHLCTLCFESQAYLWIPIMNRWLFIQKEYGQLGNRLHTHANALAWCIENNVNLVNLSFKKYSQYFASSNTHTAETFIAGKSKLANFLRYERLWIVLEKITRSDKWLNRLTNITVKEKNDSDFLTETELLNR